MGHTKLTNWIHGLQLDVKGLLWFSALFMVFRIAFIALFQDQLGEVSLGDILEALWLGFRISLKTAGAIVLLSFLFSTLPGVLCREGCKWYSPWAIRRWMYGISTAIFTFLFCLRIPYFTIFHASFNAMIINGAHDDIGATLQTGISEYGLLWRLPLAIVFCAVIVYVFMKVYTNRTWNIEVSGKAKQIATVLGSIFLVVAVGIGLRFGGAFTYNGSIHWENAARTKSNLLNEAILDDGQALKRVFTIYERSKQAKKITITGAELKDVIQSVGGNPQAATIDEAFTRTITEEKLPTQPHNVIFVLGESYGLWPFLPNYEELGTYIVQEGKAIQSSPKAIHTKYMLAHGTGTMPAVNGFVTGLADAGLYPNYEGQSYKSKYGTGIAQMMKHFGYKTVFWYGGFGTWQDVERFALAQGFDEFHGATSFPYEGGNAWGAPDGDLFKAITNYVKGEEPGEKVFHFIMTSSNHPPYSVDLAKAGFDASKVIGKGDDSIKKDDKTVNEIGHFWYADMTMGNMIREVEAIDPTMLTLITGDHSERFSFATQVDIPTFSAIPFIVYGQGVNPSWLSKSSFGSALQINPTLAELVGRKGDTYMSLMPSLFTSPKMGFNHRLYVDNSGIHEQGASMPEEYAKYIKALRTISVWRIVRGNTVE